MAGGAANAFPAKGARSGLAGRDGRAFRPPPKWAVQEVSKRAPAAAFGAGQRKTGLLLALDALFGIVQDAGCGRQGAEERRR